MPSDTLFRKKPPLDPEAPIYPNPPPGETFLNKTPGFMDLLNKFVWSRMTGLEPGQEISKGMIPVGPGGFQGPSRGITDLAKKVLETSANKPASLGGIQSKLEQTLFSMPKYSVAEQVGKGDPASYPIPLSDMDIRAMTREFGALTPQLEGQLAEKLSITPSNPHQHLAELYDWLGYITHPIFRMKPKAP